MKSGTGYNHFILNLPSSFRLQKEIHSKSAQKFTQMHTMQTKFQGQVLFKLNASVLPRFVCLTYFILDLLLTYSELLDAK